MYNLRFSPHRPQWEILGAHLFPIRYKDVFDWLFNIVLNIFSRHNGKNFINSIKERYARQVDNLSFRPKIIFSRFTEIEISLPCS